jgi:hypothetical protein
MFETYRMLGTEHEAELIRSAERAAGGAKSRGSERNGGRLGRRWGTVTYLLSLLASALPTPRSH